MVQPRPFLTFEGGEGVGKSTQIELLKERLEATGQSVITTREPGGTPAAELVRHILLSGAAQSLGAELEAMLFFAARSDHLDQVIRPALADGKWVLCDRFSDSTRVYQRVAGKAKPKLIESMDQAVVGNLQPTITIILDADPQISLNRARVTSDEQGQGNDRFEGESLAVHKKIRRGFLDLAKRYPDRCTVIDASSDVETVSELIWTAVSERFAPLLAAKETLSASKGEASNDVGASR